VALYAISAVYFAGVMVRLMLTLTPVVCMLSAVAFSSVFEHYLGDDTKRESPPAEESSDDDDRRNSGNLYDKVRGRGGSVCVCVFTGVYVPLLVHPAQTTVAQEVALLSVEVSEREDAH